ncbi:CBS domain-containing protein [Candidatus Woesearchaeota archaeon]|nr:CBS domain-containing protein [Candidatus Woesearchaeota archaeon]
MEVGEVMHACTIVEAEQSVSEAARLMDEHLASAVLVRDNGLVRGIVTERDILRKVVANKRNPDATSVAEIMSYPLITIDENASLFEASEMMDRNNIRRVVVVNGGNITGIVNTTTVSKNLRYILGREKLFVRPEYQLTELGFF